ncbi:MAG: T9SS type A sorting domain-containing protein, partial [Ginsengibacter sp.]
PEGYQIAALHAGMITPPNCFLKKPTYEAAADFIRNNTIPSLDACRNPCQQNTIRINHSFDATLINDRQVQLVWNIAEQHNIYQYEVEKATGNSAFKRLGKIPVSTDSLYSYVDDVQPGIPYQYRLVITDQAGGSCYSNIRSVEINDNKAFTIYPNPSTGKIFISMNGYIGKANFIISNSKGQVVVEKEIFSLYQAQTLDLTTLPKGVYFLKVATGKGSSVQRFLIQ